MSTTPDFVLEERLETLRNDEPRLQEKLHERLIEWARVHGDDDDVPPGTVLVDHVPEIQRVVDSAAEVANETHDSPEGPYDLALGVLRKWLAFASMYRLRVRTPHFAVDTRHNGAYELMEQAIPVIRGTVVKTAMQKTCTVMVSRMVKDKRTGKRLQRSRKYMIHDEYNQCRIGDVVVARSTRRLSKHKSHSLVAIVNLDRPGRDAVQESASSKKSEKVRQRALIDG